MVTIFQFVANFTLFENSGHPKLRLFIHSLCAIFTLICSYSMSIKVTPNLSISLDLNDRSFQIGLEGLEAHATEE